MTLFTPENMARTDTILRHERVREPGRQARAERVARNKRRVHDGYVTRPHNVRIYVHVDGKQLSEVKAGKWTFRKPAEW